MSLSSQLAAGKGRNLLTWQVDKKIPGGMNLLSPDEMDPKQNPKKIPPKTSPCGQQQIPSREGPLKDLLFIS